MTVSKLWLNVFVEMVGAWERLITLHSRSTIKKRNLNFHSNEPYWNFFNNFLYKPYMPPGHNLQPCTEGSDRVMILKDLISLNFGLYWTKLITQNFDWICLGKSWV
jgi:hypothetical protein